LIPIYTCIDIISYNRALNILFFLNNFLQKTYMTSKGFYLTTTDAIDMILNDMLIVDNIIFFPMYNKFIYTVIYYNNFKEFGLETY
jgi:hypothetical protein